MKKRLIHLLCLLCLLPLGSNASEYKMSHLTTKDGLFGDRIFKSFRDNRGYLWVLGIGGVARYDGGHITNFVSSNSKTRHYIKGGRFYAICQDAKGNIWIGGNSGLNLFDPQNDTFIPLDIKGLKSIQFVENYDTDSIWISGIRSQNFLVNINTLEATKRQEQLLFSSSALDNDGNIWLSAADGRIFKNYQPTSLHCHFRIKDICFAPSGSLYLATDNGITVIQDFLNKDLSTFSKQDIKNLEFWLRGRVVYTLGYYEGSIWAGTDNGLNRCVLNKHDLPSSIQDYYSVTNSSFSISNNLIQDILCDKEVILWISTYGGVNKVDPSTRWFDSFRYDPEANNTLHDNYIFPIHGDKDGRIWMGSYTSGVSCYNSKEKAFTRFHKDNSILESNFIAQLYSDNDGNTWIATSRKAYIYKDGVLLPAEFVGFNKSYTIKSIIQQADGSYWMGTYNRIFKFHREADGKFSIDKEIELKGAGGVFSLFVDAYKRMWIGCDKGLFLYDEVNAHEGCIPFKKEQYPALQTNLMQSIVSDSEGNIWFGSNNGLYHLANDSILKNNPQAVQFKAYFMEDGMSSDYVPGLVAGKDGEMWISSWKELMKYEPHGVGIGKFVHYSFNEGIVSEKFNRFGYYLDTLTNTAYFGSANGVNYFNIDKKPKEVGTAQILVHQILVNGKEFDLNRTFADTAAEIKVSGSIRQLKILFGSSSLLSPSKQLFAWKLEGKDEQWHYTRNRELILNDIPAGEYQLLISAVTDQRNVQPPFLIQLEVESNLYIYMLLSLFILISLAGVYLLYRFKRIKKVNTKYEYSKLSSDKSSEIVSQLNQLMEEQKPYLNPDLTVNELAAQVGVSSVKLSQVLNDFLQTRFYEYVNKYRVEEFVACLEKEENKKMTLIALSEKCGFSSKSSFYRFFKEVKGTTPAQYAKSRKN